MTRLINKLLVVAIALVHLAHADVLTKRQAQPNPTPSVAEPNQESLSMAKKLHALRRTIRTQPEPFKVLTEDEDFEPHQAGEPHPLSALNDDDPTDSLEKHLEAHVEDPIFDEVEDLDKDAVKQELPPPHTETSTLDNIERNVTDAPTPPTIMQSKTTHGPTISEVEKLNKDSDQQEAGNNTTGNTIVEDVERHVTDAPTAPTIVQSQTTHGPTVSEVEKLNKDSDQLQAGKNTIGNPIVEDVERYATNAPPESTTLQSETSEESISNQMENSQQRPIQQEPSGSSVKTSTSKNVEKTNEASPPISAHSEASEDPTSTSPTIIEHQSEPTDDFFTLTQSSISLMEQESTLDDKSQVLDIVSAILSSVYDDFSITQLLISLSTGIVCVLFLKLGKIALTQEEKLKSKPVLVAEKATSDILAMRSQLDELRKSFGLGSDVDLVSKVNSLRNHIRMLEKKIEQKKRIAPIKNELRRLKEELGDDIEAKIALRKSFLGSLKIYKALKQSNTEYRESIKLSKYEQLLMIRSFVALEDLLDLMKDIEFSEQTDALRESAFEMKVETQFLREQLDTFRTFGENFAKQYQALSREIAEERSKGIENEKIFSELKELYNDVDLDATIDELKKRVDAKVLEADKYYRNYIGNYYFKSVNNINQVEVT